MSGANDNKLIWAHFSDLKLDRSFDPDSRYPFIGNLGDDLQGLRAQFGEPDLIVFSGDIGDGRIDLSRLAESIATRSYRFLPSKVANALIAVPGNNDVQKHSAEIGLLFQLWNEVPDVREQFWNTLDSNLRSVVGSAFKGYQQCTGLLYALAEHTPKPGELPGDGVLSLSKGGRRIGVIGLNSVFNQIHPKSSKDGMLDPAQLDALCNHDVTGWVQDHDLRILVTHFPPDRLDKSSLSRFYSEIASPGRFHLHLCGHRHGPSMEFLTAQQHSLLLQAPRLDPLDPPSVQGYLFGVIDFAEPGNSFVQQRSLHAKTGRWQGQEASLPITIAPRKLLVPVVGTDEAPKPSPEFRLRQLRLENFRSFEAIALEFLHPESLLPGCWTCLAGINGAGKSSVVQAIALMFLGDPLANELGGQLLDRMRRLKNNSRHDATIHAVFLDAVGEEHKVSLHIGSSGRLTSSNPSFWDYLRSRVLIAYGATRNLSSQPRFASEQSRSQDVEQQMTVFDPLARLASAESILVNPKVSASMIALYQALIARVFRAEEIKVVEQGGQIRFQVGADIVDANDLPDGFRSSSAWLADLCGAWANKFPDHARKLDPSLIEAVVVIDEVDLHLHPSLQRQLVPRLRKELPRVQWVVTTHSPLVLANFDVREIIALDRREPNGVKPLDTQILGFTTDQIYQWLMETEPAGAAFAQELAGEGSMNRRDVMEMLIASPDVNQAEAKRSFEDLQATLSKILPGGGGPGGQ